MKAISFSRGSHSELLAFVEFYGSSFVLAVVLYQLLATMLPAGLVGGHEQFFGLLSFLVACGSCSWLFEHHRRHHQH